jgi:hypothetical protein
MTEPSIADAAASDGALSMDNSSTTTGDQTDEEIVSYTVSDEALEAAARTERGSLSFVTCSTCTFARSEPYRL